jgi:Abnormal spindle-like microcephaly-assoc'd, ASPM-SPD-2-Hydin
MAFFSFLALVSNPPKRDVSSWKTHTCRQQIRALTCRSSNRRTVVLLLLLCYIFATLCNDICYGAIRVNDTGGTPALSAFYCSTDTPLKGTVKDICTVKLSSGSSTGAVTVSLASSNSAVTVPATVTLQANATAAQFTANISSVSTTRSASLTASLGSSSISVPLQLSAASLILSVNTSSLVFEDVAVNTAATQSVTLKSTGTEPVTVNAAALTGTGFTLLGASFPLTLNPSQTATLSVKFLPTAAGAMTGQLTVSSNSTTGGATVVSLSGTGGTPTLSAFYCGTDTPLKGSGTDICTVKLSSGSSTGAVTVSLASSNSAVTVPATVMLQANATAAQFTANISSVSTPQSASLTASLGSSSIYIPLRLGAAALILDANRSSVAFQDVVVNTAAKQSITLASTGTGPVTVTAAAVTGTGFTLSGTTFPLTLNPSQTAPLGVQFLPSAAGAATGQITVSSNSSGDDTTVISLSGLAVAGASATGTPIGSFAYSGSPLINTLVPPTPSTAIANTFFGMTIANLAPSSNNYVPGMTPFPSFPVSTLRLWDVAYWAVIDTYQGQNNWIKMDNSIAISQQHGVSDFVFTFGHVPAWASTSPSDPCTNGEGAGTCTFPNMGAFDEFATQVVQRYCGKVKYYETWNEPDNPQFWDGTNAQMLTIAQNVNQIVKNPANCGCTNGSCSPNGGVNPNKVLMPPISGVASSQIDWLDSYLTAVDGPYAYADIATFHGYSDRGNPPEDFVSGVQSLQQTLAAHGLSNLELWNTEASWKSDSTYDDDQQASWLMRYHALQAALGVSRFIWYSYDNCSWGTLWSSPLCSDTQGELTEPGNAYGTIENWFIGAKLTHCQQYENGLWACELQRAGNYDAWMLWSSTGLNLSVTVPRNLGLTVYRDWQNNVVPLPAHLTVSQMPVLLENKDL